MKTPRSPLKSHLPMARTRWLLTAISMAGVLFLVTACKTAKEPKPIGADVNLAELRWVIQTQVAEPGQSAPLLGLVSQAERELGSINESYLTGSKELQTLSADHSMSSAELQKLLQDFEDEAAIARHRLIDTLLAMKPHTTAEEWPAISNAFLNSVMSQSDRYLGIRQANS
jgi:hypothetical protein